MAVAIGPGFPGNNNDDLRDGYILRIPRLPYDGDTFAINTPPSTEMPDLDIDIQIHKPIESVIIWNDQPEGVDTKILYNGILYQPGERFRLIKRGHELIPCEMPIPDIEPSHHHEETFHHGMQFALLDTDAPQLQINQLYEERQIQYFLYVKAIDTWICYWTFLPIVENSYKPDIEQPYRPLV